MIDCPHDRNDCLLTPTGYGSRTAAYFPAYYDKQGVNTNPDMNVTTTKMRCCSCNALWVRTETNGTAQFIQESEDD